MFESIQRSFELAKSSWNVLRTDTKLVVFPIISAICCFVVLLSFVGPLVGLHLAGKIDLDPNNNGQIPIWVYPVVFAFYFCNYFVIVFCNAALVSCALMRFNGQNPTIGDGFNAALSRTPQIAAWALVSATVGLLLYIIENVHEKVGEIVSAVLGTAWTIMTFFVVPVLVVEKAGPFEAISRSLAILRKAWGEALIGRLGLGLIKLVLAIPGILLLIGGAALLVLVQPVAFGIAVIVLALVYFLAFAAVSAALDTIFLTALYQYAAFDRVPAGFSRESIEGAFYAKRA